MTDPTTTPERWCPECCIYYPAGTEFCEFCGEPTDPAPSEGLEPGARAWVAGVLAVVAAVAAAAALCAAGGE